MIPCDQFASGDTHSLRLFDKSRRAKFLIVLENEQESFICCGNRRPIGAICRPAGRHTIVWRLHLQPGAKLADAVVSGPSRFQEASIGPNPTVFAVVSLQRCRYRHLIFRTSRNRRRHLREPLTSVGKTSLMSVRSTG
jgi:hypothetical protein